MSAGDTGLGGAGAGEGALFGVEGCGFGDGGPAGEGPVGAKGWEGGGKPGCGAGALCGTMGTHRCCICGSTTGCCC